MGLKASLQTFAPLLKNVRRMTVPAKELKIIGVLGECTETAIGDIAKFTTKQAKNVDYARQAQIHMTTRSCELGDAPMALFSSFEEFKASALERISKYRNSVPTKLYDAVEKSTQNNEFELTKAMKEYYAKLNECKTMEEAVQIYPEFTHMNVNFAKEMISEIKSIIPENICREAMQFSTKEERTTYVMNYLNKTTNKCVRRWQNYPDILKIQREIADEVAGGLYTGSANTNSGWYIRNKEPLMAYMLDKKTQDSVLLSYLRQYYIEGKSIKEITPQVVKNRPILPVSLNESMHFSDKHVANFRSVISTIDNEAIGYKDMLQLQKGELTSAILNKAWMSSSLKKDIANWTKYGTGWTNIKNILLKRKGVINYVNSSEEMINRFLLKQFKMNNRVVTEKNPFLQFENLENDVTKKVQRFVNNRYYTKDVSYSDKAIIESKEFQEFKSQFDIEGMKASIDKLEEHYLNIFFKMFWTDSRKARFSEALKEAYGTAKKNAVAVNDSMLMQALSEVAI